MSGVREGEWEDIEGVFERRVESRVILKAKNEEF